MRMADFRLIFHLDLDAFYCAVEELLDPGLSGKPFAVGGKPAGRGVVSSCSYVARSLGIRSAMPMARAVVICPDIIFLPGHHHIYREKSKQVMKIIQNLSPLNEQISIDEAFIDFSGYIGSAIDKARSIQSDIHEATGLPCSIGISSNKLVAKVATDIGKATSKTKTYPRSIHLVPHGEEATFLSPLPLEMLWGIGPVTASKLQELGIFNIGQLARWPMEDIISRIGKIGYEFHLRANGIDDRPVVPFHEPKSFSQEITFSRDTLDKVFIRKQIETQSKNIASSLKENNLLGTSIKIKIRWPDFSTITRQITLTAPTNESQIIFDTAWSLFLKNWIKNDPIRLIGIGIKGLQEPNRQLTLWEKTDYKKLAKLESTIFELKSRFGESAITKGMLEDESNS